MKTTLFSSTVGDIFAHMAFVNNLSATAAPTVNDDTTKGYQKGSSWVYSGAIYFCLDATAGAAVWVTPAVGQGAGYKMARGSHTIAAAQDTVVSGLATVVAVLVSFKSAPTVNVLFIGASPGDQAGSPAAGSFYINAYKPTGTGDVTPVAATVFSDNIVVEWIAVGT